MNDLTLREAQIFCHQTSVDHGWYEGDMPWDLDEKGERRLFIEKLMLIVSEVAEALEEIRIGKGYTEIYWQDGKPEGVPIELADVLIRMVDLCERFGINLTDATHFKMRYNEGRPYRHGNKRA